MTVTSAPVWKRALAWVYDALVVTALIFISGLVASVIAQGEAPAFLTQFIITSLVGGYFWISFANGGKTLGMRAWRLRVVHENDEVLRKRTVLVRLLWSILCFAPLLFPLATAYLSSHKQTIYDRLSNTRVISDPDFNAKDVASKLLESKAVK